MATSLAILDSLVRTKRRALIGYAFVLCGDIHQAEDLVQDAFIATFSRGRALNDVEQAEAYLRRVLLNTYMDGFRRRRRWATIRHLLTSQELEVGTTPDIGAYVDLQRSLATLSPRERACIILRFYDDLAVVQIASELSLSNGTVKRYLFDAMKKLRLELTATDDHNTILMRGDSVEH